MLNRHQCTQRAHHVIDEIECRVSASNMNCLSTAKSNNRIKQLNCVCPQYSCDMPLAQPKYQNAVCSGIGGHHVPIWPLTCARTQTLLIVIVAECEFDRKINRNWYLKTHQTLTASSSRPASNATIIWITNFQNIQHWQTPLPFPLSPWCRCRLDFHWFSKRKIIETVSNSCSRPLDATRKNSKLRCTRLLHDHDNDGNASDVQIWYCCEFISIFHSLCSSFVRWFQSWRWCGNHGVRVSSVCMFEAVLFRFLQSLRCARILTHSFKIVRRLNVKRRW